MAETLKDIIEQLKIQNTSSKLPVIGEIKNLGSQFGKLNLSFKRFSDSTVQLNSEMMEKNDIDIIISPTALKEEPPLVDEYQS